MKKNKNKILSLLLAIISVLNVFPFSILPAAADEGGTEEPQSVVEPEKVDDGYIEGFVTVACENSDTVILERGKKLYAFSELSPELGENVAYKWEVKGKNERWGIISGYVFPYAVISDALITSSIQKDGAAYLRCVVIKDGKKYVSNELAVYRSSDVAMEEEELEPERLLATDSVSSDISLSAEPEASTPSLTGTAADAFDIVITYTYRHATAAPSLKLDGANAANTFTVTLQKGGYYTGTIATPPEIGYLPYVKLSQEQYVTGYHKASTEQAGSDARAFPDSYYVEYDGEQYVLANSIQFDNQTDDVEVHVYFIPQQVTFRVKIYEQNLYDDEYVLAETVTYSRIANESVGQIGEKYDKPRRGFTPLYYDPNLPISEDGSFSIDIYYDRIYYHVDFILNDNMEAFGAPNCYVRYKTPVVLPTPTRPAYAFTGWTLDSVLADDNKTAVDSHYYPAAASGGYQISSTEHNVYYSAGWETRTTSYTVIYWLENPDDSGFTLDSYKVVEGVKPGDEVDAPDDYSASDKAHFEFSEVLSDKDVTVAADGTTAVNAYYLRKYYTMTFKGNGACLTPEHTHTDECLSETCSLEPHTHTMACGISNMICGKEEHPHVNECCALDVHVHTGGEGGCCTLTYHVHDGVKFSDCTKTEHKNHHMECYSRNALATAASLSGTPKTAYDNLVKRVTGPLNGYIYRIRATRNGTICNFLYVHGEWFYLGQASDYNGVSYSGRLNNPNNNATSATSAKATVICGLELHTHGDGTCTCSTPEHDHTTGCTCEIVRHVHGEGDCEYTKCGKEYHMHDAFCFTFNCNKTAHAHTADCVRACRQIEHTHTDDNSTTPFLQICRKYDSDISAVWTAIGENFTDGQRWKANTYFSQVLVYLPFMPPADITFSEDAGTATKIYEIKYFLESLETEGATYVDSYKKYFGLSNSIKAKYSYLTKKEDFFDIRGFTQLGSNPGFSGDQLQTNNGGEVSLYYSRNDYYLEFVSLGTTLSPLTKTLKYQQPIGASFEPSASDIPYPSNEEPGAIKFVGWYTTPNCADGTEFTFDGNTVMPVGGLVLYAKWESCSYTVKVYPEKGSQEIVAPYPQTVLFGSFIDEPNHSNLRGDQLDSPSPNPDGDDSTTDEEKKMIFAGWYYMDADVEKRFDFNTMPVKADMEIYAKWTSRIPIKYTVRYVFQSGEEYVDVAAPTTAMSLAGITKTFSAKVGEDLYEEYRTGYFPDIRSHTMIMSDEESENVFNFVYAVPDKIVYTVTHTFVDERLEELFGTGKYTLTEHFEHKIEGEDISNLAASVVVSFREGISKDVLAQAAYEQHGIILTDEQKDDLWEIITSLSPDFFLQDLPLTINPSENEAVFSWKENGDFALYQVIRYIESVDGSEYTVYDTVTHTAQAGITVEADTSGTIEYFTLDTAHPDTILSGEAKRITSTEDGSGLEKGLVLRLYYKRNSYEYTVYHYKNGTQTALADPVKKQARYQETIRISDEALDIPGYALHNGTETVTISANQLQSVVCYYQGLEVYYQYQVRGVGATIGNPTDTVAIGGNPPESKTLELWGDGEYFLNAWYYSVGDGEEKPVLKEWLSDDKMTVTIPAPKVEHAGKMVYVYAEVLPTIRRFKIEGFTSPENDPQAFVFRLQGKAETATADIDITFIIFDNGYTDIAHLPYGEYTLTSLHWAWRYDESPYVVFNGVQTDAVEGKLSLNLNATGDVIITYPDKMNEQWLTDDASGIVPLGKEHEKQ